MEFHPRTKLPLIPGHEFTGIVEKTGKVCVLGLADYPAPVLMKELIWKEAKIISSRVSHGEFAKAIAELSKGNLKPESMITSVIHPSETQKAFELLQSNPEEHLKILLKFY